MKPEGVPQTPAESREYQPPMLQPPVQVVHPGFQSFWKSRDSGASLPKWSPAHDATRIARRNRRLKQSSLTGPKPDASATEDEQALFESRQRLLARHDWLGLAPARPPRMCFPSDDQRERIGKRRKLVKSTALKGRRTDLSVSQPFVQGHVPFEPVMIGAIADDDIEIKVGTEAFFSQTQPTRRSRASINTSIRPISTDFDSLSEESMLLKADSDGFEARESDNNARFGPIIKGDGDVPYRQDLPEHYGNGGFPASHGRGEEMHSVHDQFDHESEQQRFSTESSLNDMIMQDVTSTYHASHTLPRLDQDDWASADNAFQCPEAEPGFGLEESGYRPRYADPDASAVHHAEVDSDYLQHTAVSEPSMVAIKGSCLTRAESQGQEIQYSDFTAGTQHEDSKQDRWNGSRAGNNDALPASGDSDGADEEARWRKFMHIKDAASSQSKASAWPTVAAFDDEMLDGHGGPDSTLKADISHENDYDQDELWRKYVIGSQSSQSQSSLGGEPKERINHSDVLLPVRLSSTEPAEQIRSDRMTTGGSTCARHEHTSNDSQDDMSSRNPTNTSLVGHATTIDPEHESVEGAKTASATRRTATAIDTSMIMEARSRQYPGPRKRTQYAPVPRTFPRVLKRASALAPPKSTFDLTTSDD